MTVSTAYAPITYAGNGATTAFPVTWPFFTGTLVVTVIASTGVETAKTLTTHYTVTGGTDDDGRPTTGTVTMVTAPASGETLRIARATALTQPTTWPESDPFPQASIETALDRLTLIAQENAAGGADGITGDVLQLNSAGAQDYWDGEAQPLSRIPFLELTESAAPSTPASGYSRLYTKTDGKLYHLNDGGTEVDLSGAGVSAAAAAISAAAAATSATTATTAATSAAASAAAIGITWTFSTTTTMADPGSGIIRLNNAALASVTAAAVDDLDAAGTDVSARVLTWDDSTNPTNKGELTLRVGTTWATYTVTGVTDNAGWNQLALTYVGSSGTIADAASVSTAFVRSGDKGADGAGSGDVVGPGAATDNAVVRFDTTTGKLIQNSTVTIADTGAIAGTTSIVPTSNDAGALGSATLSYSDLFLASGAVINFNNGNATVTHSSGLLTFSTPVTVGTANAVTLGTIEVGHASDTTINRASAGEINVESNRIWHQGNVGARIDALIEETVPDTANDYLLMYDASGTVAKKIKPDNLGTTGSWELIGTTTISSPVASVEQTFATGTYCMVRIVMQDVSPSTDAWPVITLREGSNVIVTLTLGDFSTTAGGTAAVFAEFVISADASTKVCTGVAHSGAGASSYQAVGSSGSHASEADRVRFAWSSGNIDDGVIKVYGLKV